MTEVGFTGTRKGMTGDQEMVLRFLLEVMYDGDAVSPYFHHGDCVGADENAAVIASQAGFTVFAHPPKDNKLRAYSAFNEIVAEPKDYHERNRDIVSRSDVVLACPKEAMEPRNKRGSGTWYTIGRCRDSQTPCIIIFPQGTVRIENVT